MNADHPAGRDETHPQITQISQIFESLLICAICEICGVVLPQKEWNNAEQKSIFDEFGGDGGDVALRRRRQ